ncbi:MAG TPA: shikimate kinase AroK [Xanthomonadales bacterium]|nr:shikimate kinase AroK [Xanthomonadales bacterium]
MRNVFLVGPMGSGKTTIGQKLAQRLGLEFHDTDQEIQGRTGVDISLIFEIEGEEGFRERESKVLDELTASKGVLVATGGGAVLRESNRRWLRERGVVIYLKASVEQQLARLRHDKTRPLIQLEDREARLLELARLRDPLYAELADFTFPARNRSVEASVDRIVQTLQADRANHLTPQANPDD